MQIDNTNKIKIQSIIKYSDKFTVPLPAIYVKDNNLQPKDELVIYRDRVNGKDALIIMPVEAKSETNNSVNQIY